MSVENLDIWTEILRYFDLSIASGTQEDVSLQRRTLLAVALLSRTLKSLALDSLWKCMSSLEPVCNVINSYCTEDMSLIFQGADSRGYWILRKPLTQEQRDGAEDYLDRIRDFRTQPTATRENTLWPMLVASLGLGATKSLLPGLRSLSLHLDTADIIGPWIPALLPLMSPALQSISYVSSSIHVEGVEIFQNMLKSQSLELLHIAYRGYPSPDLLQRCILFNSLESLSLEFNFEGQSIQRYTQSPVAIADVFDNLGYLKDLKIDLRVFPLSPSGSGRSAVAKSPALRSLCLTGNASDLQEFLLDGITSPSLLSLSIMVAQPAGLTWKTIFDRAVSKFSGIHTLSVQATPNAGFPQLLMQDLSSIISRTTMRSLHLDAIPHCLTDDNIAGLASSWPGLHALGILNEYGIFFGATVLVELSKLPNLQELMLPLDLMGFQAPLPMEIPTTDCPLVELWITRYSNAPSTFDQKINIARNILILFPVLNRILEAEPSEQSCLNDLEGLVNAFHGTIAIHAHRRTMNSRRREQHPVTSKERAITKDGI